MKTVTKQNEGISERMKGRSTRKNVKKKEGKSNKTEGKQYERM